MVNLKAYVKMFLKCKKMTVLFIKPRQTDVCGTGGQEKYYVCFLATSQYDKFTFFVLVLFLSSKDKKRVLVAMRKLIHKLTPNPSSCRPFFALVCLT